MKRKLTTLWHIILQWEQINDIFFELLHQNDDAEFCIIIWASFLCNILLLSDSKEEEEKYYWVQIFRKIRGLCLMKWPDKIFFWICHILFIHKPTVVFSIILFRVVLFFSQMNALVYVGINQGINKRGIKYTIHQKFWKKFIIFFFKSDTKTRNKNANKMEFVYPFSIIIKGRP